MLDLWLVIIYGVTHRERIHCFWLKNLIFWLQNQSRIGKLWMAARQKQKRSISSLMSATECCRRAGPETVLKKLLCVQSVSCPQREGAYASFPEVEVDGAQILPVE